MPFKIRSTYDIKTCTLLSREVIEVLEGPDAGPLILQLAKDIERQEEQVKNDSVKDAG